MSWIRLESTWNDGVSRAAHWHIPSMGSENFAEPIDKMDASQWRTLQKRSVEDLDIISEVFVHEGTYKSDFSIGYRVVRRCQGIWPERGWVTSGCGWAPDFWKRSSLNWSNSSDEVFPSVKYRRLEWTSEEKLKSNGDHWTTIWHIMIESSMDCYVALWGHTLGGVQTRYWPQLGHGLVRTTINRSEGVRKICASCWQRSPNLWGSIRGNYAISRANSCNMVHDTSPQCVTIHYVFIRK